MEHIAPLLENTLKQDKHLRSEAEKALGEASKRPQFGQCLLQIVAHNIFPVTVKQAAAIYFKNLARRSWNSNDSDFCISEEEKVAIRNVVVDCMISNSNKSIRDTLSSSVAQIAEFDFPKQWPNLIAQFAERIQTQDWTIISGILVTAHSIFQKYRKLHELRESDQQEIFAITDGLAEKILAIATVCQNKLQDTSVGIEEQCMVLRTLVALVEVYYDLNCHDQTQFFFDKLRDFMAVFLVCIQFTPKPANEELANELKSLVMSIGILFIEKFDEEFDPFVPEFTRFVKDMLLENKAAEEVICMGLRFLAAVCKTQHIEKFSEGELSVLLQKIVCGNLQLKESDLEMFSSDSIEFIRRDIDGSDTHTRRSSACELVKSLAMRFSHQVQSFLSQYMEYLLQTYATTTNNPYDRMQGKDIAIYLVTSLCQRSIGAQQVEPFVNVEQFFSQHIFPELNSDFDKANQNSVTVLVVKASSIKFVSTFRYLLLGDQSIGAQVLNCVVHWCKCKNDVISTYAAHAVERILAGNRLPKEVWAPQLDTMVEILLKQMEDTILERPNEHFSKALMRIIMCGKEQLGRFLPAVITFLMTKALPVVCKNPVNPIFNHYLFESLAAILKNNPEAWGKQEFEGNLLKVLRDIMAFTEFVPYVLQLVSLLLSITNNTALYSEMFPMLIDPESYQGLFQPDASVGNIPAIIRLLKVYARRANAWIVQDKSAFDGLCGVIQALLQSKKYDHDGFNLVCSVVKYFPPAELDKVIRAIVIAMLQRLTRSKTQKFVKCFVLFLSLLVNTKGLDAVIGLFESIQPGVFSEVLDKFWLINICSVEGGQERACCAAALEKIGTMAQLPDELKARAAQCYRDIKNKAAVQIGEDDEGLAWEEQQWTNVFCPLQNVPDDDCF